VDKIKALSLIFCLILLTTLVSAATISPSSLPISLQQDNATTFSFNLTLNNETCAPSYTPNNTLVIIGLPSFKDATGEFEINALAYAPPSLQPGNYPITINYCDSSLTLQATVEEKPIEQTQKENCPSQLFIFGSKIPGKTIAFDIRDSNFNPVKGEGVSVFLTSSEGETDNVQCSIGYCTWKIPENWRDTVMYQVIAPNCSALTGSFELKMAGSLQISVPSRIAYGEDFYIYVFDPTKGKITGASIEIIDPSGRPFRGRTDEGGIVKDEVLVKTYGIDIKPDKIGTYQVYASMFGYNSANATFEIYRMECPYECCEEGKYEAKSCEEGYKCVNNVCVKIEKPKVNLTCIPREAKLNEEVECKIFGKDGELIKDTVPATLYFMGEEKNVSFIDGTLTYTFNKPGSYKIKVNDFGEYEGATFKGEVLPPQIPVLTILFIVGLLILIIIIVYFLSKKGIRIFRKKEKIHWEMQPGTSFPVEEE